MGAICPTCGQDALDEEHCEVAVQNILRGHVDEEQRPMCRACQGQGAEDSSLSPESNLELSLGQESAEAEDPNGLREKEASGEIQGQSKADHLSQTTTSDTLGVQALTVSARNIKGGAARQGLRSRLGKKLPQLLGCNRAAAGKPEQVRGVASHLPMAPPVEAAAAAQEQLPKAPKSPISAKVDSIPASFATGARLQAEGNQLDGIAAVEEALVECRGCLDVFDAFGAERCVLAAIGAIEDRCGGGTDCSGDFAALVGALRARAEYADTLALLQKFESARLLAEGVEAVGRKSSRKSSKDDKTPWKLGVEMQVDLASVGLETDVNFGEEGLVFRIYYRLTGRHIETRIDMDVPTYVRNKSGEEVQHPFLVGWASMWEETALWETWHPIIAKGGALDAQKPNKFHKLWQVPYCLFFQKETSMQEVFTAFDHRNGAYLVQMDGIGPDSELWKQHPPPRRFSVSPYLVDVSVALVPRKETTSVRMHMSGEAPFPIPDFLVKWGMSWFLPEVHRRMMRAMANCLSSDGPHSQRIREDRLGTYEECKRLVQIGATLPQDADACRQLHGAARTLLAFEARHAFNKSAQV